jgi:hypothetical protein
MFEDDYFSNLHISKKSLVNKNNYAFNLTLNISQIVKKTIQISNPDFSLVGGSSNIFIFFVEPERYKLEHFTEVCFASFLSGGFITAIVVNPPERQLAKRTCVQRAV